MRLEPWFESYLWCSYKKYNLQNRKKFNTTLLGELGSLYEKSDHILPGH